MSWFNRIFRRNRMMSCEQVAIVMQEYLDGELDPAEVPKVLAHLEMCRDCGLEAEMYTRIKSSLERHRETPDAESLARLRAMAQELANES